MYSHWGGGREGRGEEGGRFSWVPLRSSPFLKPSTQAFVALRVALSRGFGLPSPSETALAHHNEKRKGTNRGWFTCRARAMEDLLDLLCFQTSLLFFFSLGVFSSVSIPYQLREAFSILQAPQCLSLPSRSRSS